MDDNGSSTRTNVTKTKVIPRMSRFSKPNVKDGMKLTRNESSAARENVVNRTRSTSEITNDNTIKVTDNG